MEIKLINLEEKFKALEQEYRVKFEDNSIFGVRLDGRGFSSFTKQFEKPFSMKFENAMNETLLAVIDSVLPTPLTASVQSDELTVIWDSSLVTPPFGGRIEKILSLSAAAATAGFIKSIGETKGTPLFDARVFKLANYSEVEEYITWRRLDSRKNAISMAVSHLHSHKSLMGVSTFERIDLLQGTAFEKIPESTFNGRILTKNESGKYELVAAERYVTESALKASFEAAQDRILSKATNASFAS